MSKASEWFVARAAHLTHVKYRPMFEREGFLIEMLDHGRVKIWAQSTGVLLLPGELVEVARWILDTFGEPPPAPIGEREAGK